MGGFAASSSVRSGRRRVARARSVRAGRAEGRAEGRHRTQKRGRRVPSAPLCVLCVQYQVGTAEVERSAGAGWCPRRGRLPEERVDLILADGFIPIAGVLDLWWLGLLGTAGIRALAPGRSLPAGSGLPGRLLRFRFRLLVQ